MELWEIGARNDHELSKAMLMQGNGTRGTAAEQEHCRQASIS